MNPYFLAIYIKGKMLNTFVLQPIIHFIWIWLWSPYNNLQQDQNSSFWNDKVVLQYRMYTKSIYHYNSEITYEDIPLLNKIKERWHGFHKWQNIGKAKEKMNVKEKA